MKELHQKEGVGEQRMLLPELSSAVVSLHNYTPIPFEVRTGHERLPVTAAEEKLPLAASQSEATKDVEELLAPGAMAVLRAALSRKGPCDALQTKADVALPAQLRSEGRVPVLKTGTGSFLVTPTPHVSLSFPSQPPFPPRAVQNAPAHNVEPPDRRLIATPERRINVQNTQRPTLPTAAKNPVSTFLVQAPGGQYCIMSGAAESVRSAEGRMLPIELTPHGISLTQPNSAVEGKTVAPVHVVPSHPMMFLKPMKTTVSLAPKLQSPPVPRPTSQPQLSQKLLERPGNPRVVEPPASSESFAAKAENLKNRFLSGGSHLPVTPIDKMSFAPLPTTEFSAERSDVSHKRRKTSTPASLDDIPYPLSAAQQAGLELLLQAAKSMGDAIPLDTDLHTRRVLQGKKALEDHIYPTRLPYSLDPALRQGLSVLDSFAGVYPLLDGSFVARCRFKGCYVLIGSFQTAEDAARAYDRVVLGIRGRKAKTNYPYSEYLTFELQNAKRAFEAKYKQCERTRRGSAWPWARAAQTLLANAEEGSEEGVSELVQSVGPLTEAIPGASVFELLQNVMLKKRDLNGTFDLIQTKIRQLQARIQAGLSTDEECDCVGQYACVASILGNLVTMQNEWERRQEGQGTRAGLLDDSSSLMLSDQAISEPKQVISFAGDMIPNKRSVSEGGQPQHPELILRHSVPTEPGFLGDEQQSRCAMMMPQNQDLHGPYTESIRWVRLLASSLWPRKRGGGMLWKAYQPLFKSNHHRHSVLELREELYLKPDQLEEEDPQS